MRFADAKPDGRAIVYAHIQADPLVTRAADLPVLAPGARMHRTVGGSRPDDPVMLQAGAPGHICRHG